MTEKKSVKKSLEPLVILNFNLYLFKKVVYHILGDYLNRSWTWKWNYKLYNVLCVVILSGLCYIFSGFENRHDLAEFIFSACLIMIDILGLQRLIKWISDQNEILCISEHMLEFTKKWEQMPEGFAVLVWYHRLLHRFTVVYLSMIAFATTTLATAPILYYLLTGKIVLAFQCYIPHIDYQSHPGFEIHVIFHGWCSFYGGYGLTAVTLFVLFTIIQNCIEIDVLRARLKSLTNIIRKTESNEEEITSQLKDIFESHQLLLEYVDSCEDLLSMQNLSDHAVIGILTCLGLFICMQQFWLVGYILMVGAIVILFMMNLLGTIIEVKLEKLSADVYEVPWYLMSLSNKKMFCYFLGNTQKTDRLSLGGRIPLCLDTFVRFYKGIYSYLMVLREMNI